MIIALGGYALSGKDTVADFLVSDHGYSKTYMSKPLEKALLTLDPYVPVESEPNLLFARYSEFHAEVGYDESKKNLVVRDYLQKLGTEIGRNMFGENCWIDQIVREITDDRDKRLWAITGVRYENELNIIHRLGGMAVWVDRGLTPINSHSSDNTLSPEDFDAVLDNRGDLAQARMAAMNLHLYPTRTKY